LTAHAPVVPDGAEVHTVRMRGLDEIAADVRLAFERVHRERFQGDPAANPRLTVDVIDPAVVEGIPTVVLLTPWTINGLAFPPDGEFPDSLEIAGRRRRVFRIELAELGAFCSVNLPLEPANLRSMAQARELTRSWVAHFRDAVRVAGRASEAAAGRLDPAGAGEDPNDPEHLPREALMWEE
jgi:hypothetical protein